jgi:hypothetical protein
VSEDLSGDAGFSLIEAALVIIKSNKFLFYQ